MEKLNTQAKKVFDAITANASSGKVYLGFSPSKWALQVKHTGTPTGGTVVLATSLNGSDFVTLATWTIGTDVNGTIIYVVDKPATFYQVTLASLSGGTSPTVSAWVAAVN
jgi:hypothetical protein